MEVAYKDYSNAQSVHKIFKQCSHCRRRNQEENKCRFKDTTCFKCQKKGHIASACRNSKSVEATKSNKPNAKLFSNSSKEYKKKK